MADWQPIETAPRDGRPVLVGWTGSWQSCRAVWNLDRWVGLLPGGDNRLVGSAIILDDAPTHWQPLPPFIHG